MGQLTNFTEKKILDHLLNLILTFYESLLAKGKRFYEPISAADLEAAALQWIVVEEEREAKQ